MRHFPRAAVAILAGLIMLFIYSPGTAHPREWLRQMATDNADALRQAALDARARSVSAQEADTPALRAAFAIPGLTKIAWDGEGAGYISFTWSDRQIEGSAHLLYLPENRYEGPAYPEWKLARDGDELWRWEGGGATGRGYIEAERLAPFIFYEEIYYPT